MEASLDRPQELVSGLPPGFLSVCLREGRDLLENGSFCVETELRTNPTVSRSLGRRGCAHSESRRRPARARLSLRGAERVWRGRAGAEGRTLLTQEACETRTAGGTVLSRPAPVPNLRGFAAALRAAPSSSLEASCTRAAKGSRRCSKAPWPGPATWELPGHHRNDTLEKQQKHARSGARLSRGLRACTFTRQQNRGDAVEVTIYFRKGKGKGKRERKTSTGLLRAPGAGVRYNAPN